MNSPYRKIRPRKPTGGPDDADAERAETPPPPAEGPHCSTHPDRQALARCTGCGKDLCKECRKDFISVAMRTRTGRGLSRLRGKGEACCRDCLRRMKKEEEYCPWEDDQLGLGKRFIKTLLGVISAPEALYLHFPRKGGLSKPIGFAFLYVLPILLIYAVLNLMVLIPVLLTVDSSFGGRLLLVFVINCFLISLSPFLFMVHGLIYHVFLFLFGARGGVVATLRVTLYSMGTRLFGLIPFVGWAWAILFLISASAGFKYVHGISRFRAILALLLPITGNIVLLGLIIFRVIDAPTWVVALLR